MGPAEIVASLKELGPVAFLIIAVLGSMYAGIASPSEAAALGVVGAFVVAAWQRSLTLETAREACFGAVQTTCMVGLIVLGAFVVGTVLANLRVPQFVAAEIVSWQLPPFVLVAFLTVFYVLLGTVLEGFSMIVLTLPVVFPLIKLSIGFTVHAGPVLLVGLVLAVGLAIVSGLPPAVRGMRLSIVDALAGR